MTDPQTFYGERIPRQFNEAFEAQHARASGGDDEANALFESMLVVDTTICVDVDGTPLFLNIDAGRMRCADAPAHPVLLTLEQDQNSFQVLAETSGDSALGFLGGLAGMAGELQLTAPRVAALSAIEGSYAFEREGEAAFRVVTHFQGERSEPIATIRVSANAYAQLQSGEINPMEAFMSGAINLDGDMQKAMALALALLGE